MISAKQHEKFLDGSYLTVTICNGNRISYEWTKVTFRVPHCSHTKSLRTGSKIKTNFMKIYKVITTATEYLVG